jgi:putative PIG3 family NAD(P)H quinone oxidoreductase
VKEPGGPDVLEIVDLPEPGPGTGQLLVRNFAAGLNRADLLQRRGLYPPPAGESDILGLEFAGEVAAVGEGVEGFSRGDRVFGLCGGGAYAEFLVVDARLAVSIPSNMSYESAAAAPEAFYTAEDGLFSLGGLKEGQTVLVHAGASGVGTAAIQLAVAAGARVIATAGTAEKAAACEELGADGVNYREKDFAEAVAGLTAGEGVDLVLDLVGASYWDRNIASLRSGGRMVLLGLLGGASAEVNLGAVLSKRLSIIGSVMRSRSTEEKAEVTARFRERTLPLLESGELKTVVDSILPLEDVRQAHERMEENLNTGKIILRL